MVKKWWYFVLLVLLPYSVSAYKVNLDCPATVEPESTVSCDLNLFLSSEEQSAGGVQGLGVDFLLESDVYDFSSASMTFLQNDGITYSSDSDNFVESVNYDGASPNQLHLTMAESSRAFTPAESFARLTFTAPAEERELQFFITPVDFGYFDATNVVEQSCDVTQCTETGEASKVKVVVESAGLLGDVDGDGILTLDDSTAIARYVLGIPTTGNFELSIADVDCGGDVNLDDSVLIARVVLGIPGFSIPDRC